MDGGGAGASSRAQREWTGVGEGDAGQVSGGIDAAAAGTLASAMVTREEVKVTVGVVDSRAHGG